MSELPKWPGTVAFAGASRPAGKACAARPAPAAESRSCEERDGVEAGDGGGGAPAMTGDALQLLRRLGGRSHREHRGFPATFVRVFKQERERGVLWAESRIKAVSFTVSPLSSWKLSLGLHHQGTASPDCSALCPAVGACGFVFQGAHQATGLRAATGECPPTVPGALFRMDRALRSQTTKR